MDLLWRNKKKTEGHAMSAVYRTQAENNVNVDASVRQSVWEAF